MGSIHAAEEHGLHVVPASEQAFCASHGGDTPVSMRHIMGTPLGWRGVRCSEDAEVGDFSNEDLLHPDLIWTSLLVYPPPGKYLPLKSNYLQVGGQKISMSFPY